MADIKTRDVVKGSIKTIDKAAVAGEPRMKQAYISKGAMPNARYGEEDRFCFVFYPGSASHLTNGKRIET